MTEKNKKTTVLIVDDEESDRLFLEYHLNNWGFRPLLASNGLEALRVIQENQIKLIISDHVMPEMDGLALLKIVKERYGGIPFIMATAYGSVEKAVISIKEGANDYLQKPINPDELKATINRSINYHKISEENLKLKEHLRSLYSFQNMTTMVPAMEKALRLAEKVAKIPDTTVAIYGESGTGKEVLARAIHFAGEGMENRFVAVNCAGIPSGLLESELFGHVKGAFTGADKDRRGKFELAQGGTILLDEIGDMPWELQTKLLRVLEERSYERVGSNKTILMDCRVIAATHRNLEKLVKERKFREDLYHRANTFPITLPSLREREKDIPILANHFLGKFREHIGKKLPGISESAMNILMKYPWPGNIRELKNCIERAMILANDELISPEHLIIRNSFLEKEIFDDFVKINFDITLDRDDLSMDKIINRVLQIALERCHHNKSRAAEFLKVDRKIFYRRK